VFLCQYEADRTASTYFVDGGVLDNAPFDLVIDAIARRRAESRVYRQVVYIQPDPGQDLYAPVSGKPADTKRRWLKDLFAVSTVRGSHPILAELTKLRDMNWRIAEVQAIAEQQERYVEDRTKDVLKAMMPAGDTARLAGATTTQLIDELTARSGLPPDDVIRKVSNEAYARAQKSLGATWSTYQRLKFEAVLNRLADEINVCLSYPKPSAEAGFVAASLIAWARHHDAWQHGPENTAALGNLLQDSDMPYRERRLVFILARINELYDLDDEAARPPAGDIDVLKAKVWSMIADIRTGTLTAVDELRKTGALDLLRVSDEEAVRLSPQRFASDKRAELQDLFDRYSRGVKSLSEDSAALLTAFRTSTKNWTSDDARDSLLNRYLGFALWDGMLFPTISLSELPQLSPIPVTQFSPLTATALKPPADKGETKPVKLKGIPVHHFAAFFQAKYRENDYLWGRLDGAELILRMLSDVAKKHASEPIAAADETPPHLAAAFKAVLDTEQDLGRVKDLRKHLAEQVDALGQARVSASP
jgi:patatin-related protein